MKTLLITYDFPPMVSGIGTFFYNVWKNMPGSQDVLLAPAISDNINLDSASGLNIIRYPNPGKSRLLRVMVLLPRVMNIIKRNKTDVVVCAVPVSIGLIGLIIKKVMRKPYIVFYYGGEKAKYSNNRLVLRIIESVLKGSSGIVTNSDFTLQEVAGFGVDRKKMFKVTPGVDSNFFKPGIDSSVLRRRLGLENKRVILSVSRLVRRKGIDAVIDAMSNLVEKERDLVYIVAGDGPDRRYLEDLAIKKGVKDKILFTGHIADSDLPTYYNLCEFYVMPNRQTSGIETLEGFGISFMEAAACGKASIAGRSGGSAEAVLDGQTGILVNAMDCDEVTNAIMKLLRDTNYAKKLGDNGRERAVRDFSWVSRGKMMKNILEGVECER